MDLPNLKASKSFPGDENLNNSIKSSNGGILRSSSVPSPTDVDSSSKRDQTRGNLSELLKSSWQLQNEINGIFEELRGVNLQVRADIDDFCRIRDNSNTNINNPTDAD